MTANMHDVKEEIHNSSLSPDPQVHHYAAELYQPLPELQLCAMNLLTCMLLEEDTLKPVRRIRLSKKE